MKRRAKNGRTITKMLWSSTWPGGGIKEGHFLNPYMFGRAYFQLKWARERAWKFDSVNPSFGIHPVSWHLNQIHKASAICSHKPQYRQVVLLWVALGTDIYLQTTGGKLLFFFFFFAFWIHP